MSRASSDLDFYRSLRQFDVSQPYTRAALGFARVWADLAQRIIAAQAAQRGENVPFLPALAYPALLAYLQDGAQGLARQFRRFIPDGWPSAYCAPLADSAEWLAQQYNPLDPARSSYQVWIGPQGADTVRLFGPPGAPQPPEFLQLAARPPVEEWLGEHPGKPAALIAHYDLHGLAMLALSLRYLTALAVPDVYCAMSFEWTGDISKLWKRAVPKTCLDPAGYATVALIDCSVHSRQPEYTLKAITRLEGATGCRLFIVDHHIDTALLAPQLMHPQVELVLTDIYSCALSAGWDESALGLRALGALGDKSPEIAAACTPQSQPQLYALAHEINRRLIGFSPTPPDMKAAGIYPLEPLWETLAAGGPLSPEVCDELFGALPPEEPLALPACVKVGSLAVVTERLNSVGRTWYGLLEQVMRGQGLDYATAVRVMDERRANILLLTDWQAVHTPPVRHFIPEQYLPRCLGHPAAVWADLDISDALPFLSEVAERMNHFLGTPGSFDYAAGELRRNILDAPRGDAPVAPPPPDLY